MAEDKDIDAVRKGIERGMARYLPVETAIPVKLQLLVRQLDRADPDPELNKGREN